MAGESEQISQDEIEKLLSQSRPSPASPEEAGFAAGAHAATPGERTARDRPERDADASKPHPTASSAKSAAGMASSGQSGLPASDIEFLFKQAEQALASVQGPLPTPPGVTPYKLVDFGGAPPSTENATLDLLRDVELDLKIELGRTHMYLEDVLRLSKGAVVPLDRLAGDPVDIYVNGRLIARGEVLILNDNFCVRVAELVAGEAPAPAQAT
jgi:flagellar motor switch protein FliN/FliY